MVPLEAEVRGWVCDHLLPCSFSGGAEDWGASQAWIPGAEGSETRRSTNARTLPHDCSSVRFI